jgi:predicted ATPase
MTVKSSSTPLRTLGGLGLESSRFTRPKPLLLLAYLALEGPQPRRHVAELFWPTAADHMKSLTVLLTQLRQGAPGVVEADDKKISATVTADVMQFLTCCESGRYEEAVKLYGGAFLEGFYLHDWSEELEEWVYKTRELLAERARHALLTLAQREASSQKFFEAASLAERAYLMKGAAPLEPKDMMQLYTLLLAGENPYANKLREEAEEFDLTLVASVDEARATFGTAFEKITSQKKQTLPKASTSFVGRDLELTDLSNLLLEPKCSLVTLLGPPGVGKTRLALQLAQQENLGAFKDGIYVIFLETLTQADLLPLRIAEGIELELQGKTSPLEQLQTFIKDRDMLLVLDNFEQLSQDATLLSELLRACPNLKLLVTSRERLRLEEEQLFLLSGLSLAEAATSLQDAEHYDAVNLFAQRAKKVKADFMLTTENVASIIKVCQLVEGLPLGVELAAAWVRALSCEAIVRELEANLELLSTPNRNTLERHKSIRAAFDSSWKLLTDKEQTALSSLSVFEGGFTRSAASEVAAVSLTTLASLLDKSLLRSTGERFEQHPLLRRYGLEKLEKRGERENVARRHSEFFLKFAETLEPFLVGIKQEETVDALGRDHDNLRAVLNRAQLQNDVETGLRLGAAVWRFWNVRGHLREGRRWLEQFIHASASVVHGHAKAKALNALGTLVFQTNSFPEARPYFESSLALWRTLGDEQNALTALNNLTWVLLHTGQVEPCRAYANEALNLAQKLQQPRAEALALNNLGWLEQYQGSFVASRHLFEGSLTLREKVKDERGVAFAQCNLALTLVFLGDYDLARALLSKAIETLQRLGDKQLLAHACDIGAVLEMFCDDREKSERFLQKSLELSREVGNDESLALTLNLYSELVLHEPPRAEVMLEEAFTLNQSTGSPWYFTHWLYVKGKVALAKGEYDDARRYLQEGLAYCETLGTRYWKLRCLEVSAELEEVEGNLGQSVRYLAVARTLREEASCPVPPREQKAYQRRLETLREKLGKQFEDYWLSARVESIAQENLA